MDFFSFVEPYILPLLIGVMVLVLLLLAVPDILSRRGRQRTARGVVFDHVTNKDEKGDTFTPKVRFTTDDGRQMEFADNFGVANRALAIGKPLTVIYPADNPERARVSHPLKRVVAYLAVLAILAALIFAYLPSLGIGAR